MSMDWSKIALIFPGQGSQVVGMGADLVARFPEAAAVFEEADRVFGVPFMRLCFDGPAATLDDTLNTQPAVYVIGVATLRALEARLGAVVPAGVAGHSVGELTALTAAGALSLSDGLRLVRERARLMSVAGAAHPGAMAALIGPTVAEAQSICAQASAESGEPVVVANENCPGQVVISGDGTALDRALEIAKERGVKRALRLAVSVAAHSPLMQSAADAFRDTLAATPFSSARFPVIDNASVHALRDPSEIQAALGAQITAPVHWTESIQALRALGAETFLELGPKDVLTGLLKRIDRDAVGVPINSAAALDAWCAEVQIV